MNKRLRYLELTVKSHTSKIKSIERIIEETKSELSVEKMAEIVFTPTQHEQSIHIAENKLTCDRCKTNEHLVAVPVLFDFKGDLIDNVEYYCGKEDKGSPFFSKCWNHVQGYENRQGDNTLTQIQEME